MLNSASQNTHFFDKKLLKMQSSSNVANCFVILASHWMQILSCILMHTATDMTATLYGNVRSNVLYCYCIFTRVHDH